MVKLLVVVVTVLGLSNAEPRDGIPDPEGDSNAVSVVMTRLLLTWEPDATGCLGDYCSLRCAVDWDVSSSSTLAPQGAFSYDAANLCDGYANTAWVEGKAGDGVGERITFRFEREHFRRPELPGAVPMRGLTFLNGYAKDPETWAANGRLKKVRVLHNDDVVCDIELIDTMSIQEASFDEFEINPGDWVTVQILEIYPGSRFKDTALSELIPEGAH
jgi:hypothetical protein